MTLTSIKRILFTLMFTFSAVVNAQQLASPYQGSVVVGESSEAKLKELALKQVLVKVSGNTDISKNDETTKLLKKTQQMISQYGYRSIEGEEYFSVVFDRNKINQALKDMQQPIWGDTRPTTLIWLINNNKLVSDNQVKAQNDLLLSNAVKETELARGIRVQFPLMDLEDNLALSVSDVKGRFYDQLSSASSRYERSHFVAAELQNIGNDRWKLNWQLLQTTGNLKQSKNLLSEEYVDSQAAVMEKMINAIADYYAAQYAVVDNKGEKFTQVLHIDGINSLTELSKLNNVLKNLQVISTYNVVSAQGQQLSVAVKINGSIESFENTLSAHPHLQMQTRSMTDTSPLTTETIDTGDSESLTDIPDSAHSNALYFNWR
ncbi:hypothetical protein GCM10007916_22940 [Psychromonas marina]|uniref:DUF2066 domain-containing protein n=1 Tax=Psychromonas marina TaxID=88364 RepID=A0ABQ6E1M4_9GAMM|nr:DUF2066 domain-containing protein [Psychromonas marina]GLS91225.1 hypothetical protein GCM10007916_22940 [Psychromonas marina]